MRRLSELVFRVGLSSCHPVMRRLDSAAQISAFGKLKLRDCARAEWRAGFFCVRAEESLLFVVINKLNKRWGRESAALRPTGQPAGAMRALYQSWTLPRAPCLRPPPRASLPSYLHFGRTNSKFLNENSKCVGARPRSACRGAFGWESNGITASAGGDQLHRSRRRSNRPATQKIASTTTRIKKISANINAAL
jgi:hypothetical protein